MASATKPVLTMVTYRAKKGSEEQLAGVLRTQVARLREMGLIADRPHFVAERTDEPGIFVESYSWLHRGAIDQARDNSEVQEIWMRLEDLCQPAGIERIELQPLD